MKNSSPDYNYWIQFDFQDHFSLIGILRLCLCAIHGDCQLLIKASSGRWTRFPPPHLSSRSIDTSCNEPSPSIPLSPLDRPFCSEAARLRRVLWILDGSWMPDDPIMRPLKIHVCLVVEKTPFEPHRSSTSPPSPPSIPLLSIVFANGDCLLCRISSLRVCEGYITRFSRFFGKKNKSTKLRDSGCVSRLYYREPRNEIRKERKGKGGGRGGREVLEWHRRRLSSVSHFTGDTHRYCYCKRHRRAFCEI